MKIGTAGTVFEFVGYSPAVADIDDKKRRLDANKRKDLTFEKFMAMVDTDHISKTCALQWLRILVNYVPALKKYKTEVRKEYDTTVARKLLPPQKT